MYNKRYCLVGVDTIMKKKILILSASTGGGHNRAARAIEEELSKLDIDCEIIDSLKFVSKMVDKVISTGYEKSALYTPKAYGQMYKISDTDIVRKGMDKNLILKYMTSRLEKLLKEKRPDGVIGTHPFPVMALSKLKEKKEMHIPLYSVITDYTIHSAHIAKEVDGYIVGDEYVKSLLEYNDVATDKIYTYGIPIEKRFLDPVDSLAFKNDLGLNDKFTVLLMGGSFGAGNITEVLKDLISIKENIQIIIVCGRNTSLLLKVTKFIKTHSVNEKEIIVMGFTEKMNALMSISDCIITKPGGLTTTECILKEVPMIVPFYIPGQEKENLDFLLNNGLAVKPEKNLNLEVIIKTFIADPSKLERIKASMRYCKKEDSAKKIALLLEEKTKNI